MIRRPIQNNYVRKRLPLPHNELRRSASTRACNCQVPVRNGGRFWWLEYTPVPFVTGKCNGDCAGKHFALRLRLALAQFGIPFAITASLSLFSENGNYGISPALSAQRVVSYESPVYRVLDQWKWDNISFDESREQLRSIYISDPTFSHHRDPAGESYLHVSKTLAILNQHNIQF